MQYLEYIYTKIFMLLKFNVNSRLSLGFMPNLAYSIQVHVIFPETNIGKSSQFVVLHNNPPLILSQIVSPAIIYLGKLERV